MTFFIFIVCFFLHASDSNEVLKDKIYQNNINTVLLHKVGWQLSYPFMELNSNDKLKLSFDDLAEESNNYSYILIHCNYDWTVSDIAPSEYLDGFFENHITDYAFSFNTKIKYTHYELIIPNENINLNLSGNYIIKVYKDFDQEQVILTKRFYVYESLVTINTKVKRPMLSSYINIGQEVDFNIQYEGYSIEDPFNEIKVILKQNGRSDNAIKGLSPVFIRNNELLYDYNEENIFSGGSEYRYFDIKSLRYQSEYVKSIEYKDSIFFVELFPDEPRYRNKYFFNEDLNGKFLIKIQEEINSETDADYVKVKFSMPYDIPEIEGDMYVIGGLTNWQFTERNKMVYSLINKKYELTLLLKQGYYNYEYAFVKNGSNIANNTFTEGSHYETENDYLIFVYHRPNISRQDRLIGIQIANSLK